MGLGGWLATNLHRYYPFVDRDQQDVELAESLVGSSVPSDSLDLADLATLPARVIADFGCIMDGSSGFVSGTSEVWLSRIGRTGASSYLFRFEYTGGAQPLDFTVTAATPDGIGIWATSGVSGYCDNSAWRGFLTVVEVSRLDTALAVGAAYDYQDGDWTVEPARVISLADSRVTSINLANRERILARPSDECASSSSLDDPDEREILLNTSCLTGHVLFSAGYNADIEQQDAESTLIFGAYVGAGAGRPCDEIPLGDEEPPPGSVHLSGGPACNEVVLTVCGLPGPDVPIVGGFGIRAYVDPETPSRLIVERNLSDYAVCPTERLTDSSSEGA